MKNKKIYTEDYLNHLNDFSSERVRNLKKFLLNDILNETDIHDLLDYIDTLEDIVRTIWVGGNNEI